MLSSSASLEPVVETELHHLKSQLETAEADSIENIKRTAYSLSRNTDNFSRGEVKDILWHGGINLFKESKYETALEIYIICLEFCSREAEKDKLYHNIATCYLSKGDVVAAEKYIVQLKDESSMMDILLFQVALAKGDEVKAIKIAEKITDEALLQTAAILAFKSNSESIARKTLYKSIHTSSDTSFRLVALRCLLRLSKSPQQDSDLYQLLDDIDQISMSEKIYFADSAWNSALKAKPDYELMIKILKQCLMISSKMPVADDVQFLDRKRNCCLLIIAACLQLSLSQEENQESHLNSAMEYLAQFKSFGNANLDNTTTIILILYELECAVRLNVPNVVSLIGCVNTMEHIPLSTMDRVVDICMMSKDKLVNETALKSALEHHLTAPDPKWSHISKLFIHMAKISSDIIQVFKYWFQYANKFPEEEAAWMICEAWNQGIKSENIDFTQDLCTMAHRASQNLPNYKDIYSKHMKQVLNSK